MKDLSREKQLFEWDDGKDEKSYIELRNFQKNHEIKGIIPQNEIIFLLKGECKIYCDLYEEFLLTKGQGVFFTIGSHYILQSNQESTLIIVRLNPFQKIEGCYSLDELYEESQKSNFKDKLMILQGNSILEVYLDNLAIYLRDGITNKTFFDIKIKELMFILSNYYTKESLTCFFKPILNTDLSFASFIFDNWQSVKTAKELAAMTAYCETSFGKKFKKVFGVTPYKWLNEKRSTLIFYEIANTTTPFKVIAEKFSFNSQQHLNDYCLRYFQKTPGNIRRSQKKLH